jgi:Family of unknown function (DUF6335)
MKKRKKSGRKRVSDTAALQGPPPREAVWERSDAERGAEEDLRAYTSTSPRLTCGDVDADWRRAGSVGEEAVGGSLSTPDQDVVDEIGGTLGVSRAPDEEFRPSSEILEQRDRKRLEQEE